MPVDIVGQSEPSARVDNANPNTQLPSPTSGESLPLVPDQIAKEQTSISDAEEELKVGGITFRNDGVGAMGNAGEVVK